MTDQKPPIATGTALDLHMTEAVDEGPYDLSPLFDGDELSYRLAPSSTALPTGLVLTPGGLLTGTPPILSAPLILTIQAENEAGVAEAEVWLTVSSRIRSEARWAGDKLIIELTQFLFPSTEGLALTSLTLDGVSILAQIQDAAQSPNLVLLWNPGRRHTGRPVVTALKQPLDVGVAYLLSYDVVADRGTEFLFVSDAAGAPFDSSRLPYTLGIHHVFMRARDRDTAALLRVQGDLTLANVSCRRVEWVLPLPRDSAGKTIAWEIATTDAATRGSVVVREPAALFVSPDGQDVPGMGARQTPFRQPGFAARFAQPGDTIYLRPGVYAPFDVTVSGTAGHPITFTTLQGEERQAIISGARTQDAPLGGILIKGQDHIHVRNLTIEDMVLSGIFVLGVENEQHGHHVFAGNVTRRTGNAGIFVTGYLPHQTLDPDDVRTVDILIEHNDISETNIATALNAFRGGVNECISVAAGVDGIITRYNHIHHSRQYGIDYKLGVRNGAIYGNTIWDIERYGIYLDSARRYVENIDVYDNIIFRCSLGITLAREAAPDPANPDDTSDLVQTLKNINVYNNLIYDIGRTGIYCHAHPKDGPFGEIANIRINFNTIYNCGTTGVGNEIRLVGWTDAGWDGILDNFECVGNILWRDPDLGTTQFFETFSGVATVVIEQNLVAVDPLFADPLAVPPDLSVTSASPAIGLVSADFTVPPFETSLDGTDRTKTGRAGAY